MRFLRSKPRLAWALFGLTLTAITVYIFYAFIGTLVFGIFFYYATRPVHRRLYPYLQHHTLTAASSLLLVALPVLMLLNVVVLTALREYHRFKTTYDLDLYSSVLVPYFGFNQGLPSEQLLTAESLRVILTDGLTYLSAVGTGAIHLFVMITIAFYLLRDDHRIRAWLTTFQTTDGLFDDYLTRVDRDFHHIFFGNILNALIASIIATVVYIVLNTVSPPGLAIPYPTLLGILTGVTSLIPVIGMKLVYVPMSGYLFAISMYTTQSDAIWFPAAVLGVAIVLIDGIPDILLRSYVSGKTLHIGLLMLAYILGPILFGWYGLFLAPIFLVLTVHFAQLVLPRFLSHLTTPDANPPYYR